MAHHRGETASEVHPAVTPKAKKILLTLGVVGALSGGACIACGVLGGASLQQWAAGLRQEGLATEAEAHSFATAHDQTECIDEGRRRDRACGADTAITCHAHAGVFLTRCLDDATPVAGTCDGVPPTTEIMQSVHWSLAACADEASATQQACTRLMQAVQRHCERAAAAAPAP